MIKRILGLDVSSTTIGIALLLWNDITNTVKLDTLTYLKPIKTGTLLERLYSTRNRMGEILNQLKPDQIAIEDILFYVPGKSSANTITVLASFNRMIGVLAIDYLQKTPYLYSVGDIRRGIKPPHLEKLDKQEVPDVVANYLNIKFPWRYNKRTQKPLEENLDMADGLAVALYHTFIIAGHIKPPIRTKKQKRSKIRKKKK
jgi:Holliday junction resolvasome RuvABC endonuclease subunit